MSFVERRIDVTFQYGTGADGVGEPTVVKHSGLRATASVVVAGGASLGELQLRIYGMTLSDMNALSTLGVPVAAVRNNRVLVEAGDDVSGMAQIYDGTIFSAWTDFQEAPNVSFNVTAHAGLFQKMKVAPPTSFKGSADVAVILSNLCRQMGYTFENNGVSVLLANPYYPGTPLDQAQAAARAANIEMVVDNGVLAIWPKGGSRRGSATLISPATGMRGYPTYTANGLLVSTLFNPTLRFGGLVKVDSLLDTTQDQAKASGNVQANQLPVDGTWKVVTITHDLAAQYPGGPWFTELMLTIPGLLSVSR